MSELTTELIEAATRVFSDHCTKDVLDAAESGTFPHALWSVVEECGIPSMLACERDGGISAAPHEAVSVLRVAAQHSAPIPLAETMIARWLLSRAGLPFTLEPASIVFARGTRGWRVEQSERGDSLYGRECGVPWGGTAKVIIVVARDGARTNLGMINASDLRVESRSNIAGEPRDDLSTDGLAVTFQQSEHDDLAFRMANIFRGAQICGALERILELSVSYARDRVQFGRPLSKFQAIQQQLAVLAGAVASARAITEAAARVVTRDDGDLMVAAMRSRLADAIDTGAAIAHQVHGAMGFTREYSLHCSTRRLWAWRDEYGSVVEWRERLGRAFAGTSADQLWARLAVLGAQSEA